jgi:adenosylcobinamide-GDP ribazoletransferase
VSPPRAAAAAGLAVLAAFLAVPARAALLALLATTAAGLGTVWLARRQIGGQTGDVCGAAEQAAECLALTAMAAALAR